MDIQVQFAGKIDIAELSALSEQLEGYSDKENISITSAQININPQIAQTRHYSEELGFRLTSKDKKYMVQIKKIGFTFSQIKDYESWERFQSIARELWEKYFNSLKPIKITRVGLRYINRIDIPATNFNLEEYFETYPRVFSGNKGNLSGFFLQLQIPQTEGNLAILNQTITNPPEPGYTSVLFDIDVFDLKQLNANDENAFWEKIKLLRMQKNKLFNESITLKTKELFS